MKYDDEIRCDDRQNWYHELCVIKCIEDVIFSENLEDFLRHT